MGTWWFSIIPVPEVLLLSAFSFVEAARGAVHGTPRAFSLYTVGSVLV